MAGSCAEQKLRLPVGGFRFCPNAVIQVRRPKLPECQMEKSTEGTRNSALSLSRGTDDPACRSSGTNTVVQQASRHAAFKGIVAGANVGSRKPKMLATVAQANRRLRSPVRHVAPVLAARAIMHATALQIDRRGIRILRPYRAGSAADTRNRRRRRWRGRIGDGLRRRRRRGWGRSK